ncbi:protein FAM180B [Hemicordylus capensis]|uniref:protein FAM180B n=1 Tax=Hemicordylus capensis TaxID=884348 RepID=UPI0023026E43|nr:protein FAM180B [Hemicordylus capensis]
MAGMLQLQFGTSLWAALVLCVLAGPWTPADEQINLKDPTATKGLENADIILELLWGGIELMANETIRIEDEELASLRPAKRLLHILQHKIPKNPAAIEEYLDHLSQSDTPITSEEFEQLLFITVYSANKIRLIQGLEKNLWINLFTQLVSEIIRELCKRFCPSESMDSVQLLASRPWQEMPFYITVLKQIYQSSTAMAQRGRQ